MGQGKACASRIICTSSCTLPAGSSTVIQSRSVFIHHVAISFCKFLIKLRAAEAKTQLIIHRALHAKRLLTQTGKVENKVRLFLKPDTGTEECALQVSAAINPTLCCSSCAEQSRENLMTRKGVGSRVEMRKQHCQPCFSSQAETSKRLRADRPCM